MRILFLMDGLRSGGKERRLIELIKGFSSYPDVKMHLVLFSENIHYKEIHDLDIELTILKRIPKKNPLIFYHLFKVCRTWGPDVIHSWGSMAPILAIPSVFFLKKPLANSIITDAPENVKAFKGKALRIKLTKPFSRVILSNSLAGLNSYGINGNDGVCIYNGFDQNRIKDLISQEEIRQKFDITTKFVVGMVGSFTNKKDYTTFIDAAIEVLKSMDNVTFLAVGGGPKLTGMKNRVPLELKSKIIFTGLQKNVESIVNIFDIGVLCTNHKVHGEGVSNAILEYMGLAKPVVGSIGGGTVETIVDGETGFLIPPSSVKSLTDKIIQLLNDHSLRIKFGDAGRERLNKQFSLKQMTKAHYKLYKKIV